MSKDLNRSAERREPDLLSKVQLPQELAQQAYDRIVKKITQPLEAQTNPLPLPTISITGREELADRDTVTVSDTDRTRDEKANRFAADPMELTRIGNLIEQLDSDNFQERQEGQEKLTKLGSRALGSIADRLAALKNDPKASLEQKHRLGKAANAIMQNTNIHSNKELLNDSLKLRNKNLIDLIASSANDFSKNPDKAIDAMFDKIHNKEQMPAKMWQSVADVVERADDSFTKWARAAAKIKDAPQSVKNIVKELDKDHRSKHYGEYRSALGKLTASEIHHLLADNSEKVSNAGELTPADRAASRAKSQKLFEDVVAANQPLPFNHPHFRNAMDRYLEDGNIKTSDMLKTVSKLQDQVKKSLGTNDSDLANNFTFTALYAFERGMSSQRGDNQKLLQSAFQDTFKRLEQRIDSMPPKDQKHYLTNLLKSAQRTNDRAAQDRVEAKLKELQKSE